jgi:RES domain-containing protein
MAVAAWRVIDERFGRSALSGEGGLHASGRWHRRGRRVVYLAGSLSLAALEVFVHLQRSDSKIPFVAIRVDIPDRIAIETVEARSLAADWRMEPPSAATQDLGLEWLASGRTPLLRVPSAVIPIEFNYILNPGHRDAASIESGNPEPFRFDSRLWK